MNSLRVLLTGATGYIAGQLLPALREGHDLRLIDVRDTDGSGNRIEGIEILDLLSADEAELAPLFSGVDAVVHCGHSKPEGESPRAQYEGERRNLDMMQRVYQLSLDNGVRRVVAASTNQAAKWYENPYYAGLKDRVGPEDYPRPDSFYGWAKAAWEPLGFLYACGSLGRKLEVVQIRIVVPREIDASIFEDAPPERYVRELAGYISERDMQQLFLKSIETPNIEDEHGVPFHIFYGVSNNARRFWSITNARKVIGYEPQDDSEVRFADDIARLLHGKTGA
ncbi:NAD-dependent epimerase/dehydratase family protein [Rubrobacter tropicus]|uniref:NAD-dependent epimerase/dehydratase family protein n=1 Tax=Rubrobacter tropicus TaxID=2653851 RepID=A0A6G8QBA0_9ACTN|nr:NAD(P)-dependent oxidoreductase [Rubrobacter tropicus]QIN83756.1 NAD-dependent epimerase/dehydratase family protein [Rubrobacter tropicus]